MASIIEEYSNTGQITLVLEQLLLGGFAREGPVRFVLDAVNGIYTVVMGSGIQILIFLAGLQAVPASMYEAAKMEGATAWESFWKITLPLVSSLILVASVYTIIDTCLKSDSALYTKIRTAMVNQMEYGFSSAMSWIYFVVIMAIVLLVVGILSKVVFYDE
jgi:ABC-type sugar transport system permease subunit